MHGARAGKTAVVLPQLPEATLPTLYSAACPPRAQGFAYSTGLPGPQGECEFSCIQILIFIAFKAQVDILALQDKISKELSFILANQETIQSQITQLEAAIKQMEVHSLSCIFFIHMLQLLRGSQMQYYFWVTVTKHPALFAGTLPLRCGLSDR